MDFNFSGLADIQKASNNNYLQPWSLNEMVEFTGITGPVTGGQGDKAWKAWDFKFKCPNGEYSERIFEPNEESLKRRTTKNSNGHESELPSDFERTQLVVMQILDAYNPKGADALRKNGSKIHTFDQFMELVKKALANPTKPTKEHNIMLKLNGRTDQKGKTYARLPYANIGDDGKPWMSKFIGENVTLSSYELGKQEEYKKAKPSNPEKTNPVTASIDEAQVDNQNGAEIDDFDNLLN